VIDRCLPLDSVAFDACYTFQNVSQLSLAFPIPDALLLGTWMNIACTNCFSFCLRDTNRSIIVRVPRSEILACHSWEIIRVLEYVGCDILARIKTGFLNELMGTTGRADNFGSSRDTVMIRVTFSMCYFRDA
jgi:hypothetical protein